MLRGYYADSKQSLEDIQPLAYSWIFLDLEQDFELAH